MKKYKLRLPLIAAALMLVVELVLLISCYGIAIQTKRHLSEEDFGITGFRIQQKAENRFAAAETVLKACEDESIVAFTEASTATLSEEALAGYAEGADRFLDSLEIPEGVVDSVLILGSTYDKIAFVKRIGEPGFFTGSLPKISQLRFARMSEWDASTQTKTWNYYKPGYLDEEFDRGLRTGGVTLSDDVRVDIRYFLSLLDGKIVLTARSSFGGSQIFITVPATFLSPLAEKETAVTLFREDELLASSADPASLSAIIGNEKHEEDVWIHAAGSDYYNNRRIPLSTEGFFLVVSAPLLADDYSLRFFPATVGYAAAFVLLSALLALGLTAVLMRPLEKLKRTFDEQFNHGNYREIGGYRKKLPFPMLYRVLLILLLSVMGPAVASGLLFQSRLHSYVMGTNYEYLEKVSLSTAESVRDRMDYTTLVSSLYPEKQIADYIEGEYKVDSILKTRIDTVFAEGGLFSHYAIFDQSRREIYNSRTVVASEPLILNRTEGEKRRNVTMAVDNTRSGSGLLPAIVYRVERHTEEESEPVGYFVLYLNMARFYELRPDIGHEFFLTGPDGQILISSVSAGVARNVLDQIGSLSDGRSLSNDEYQVMIDQDGVFGGKIVTYNDMRYYTAQRETLRYRYYLVFFGVAVLILAAAIWLSRRLAWPLTRIGESLENIGDVSEFRPVAYTREDEIAGLIESYNRMVARMSSLIEENARRINRENELIALNTRTELQMLQQQINPHLLYNTLEFISYNAKREGSSAAGDMAMALADFFRYTTSVREDIVPFRDELTHVKNYIAIHRLRYGERFDTVYTVTDEAMNCRVVKFILQPFVENAFKYGIANKLRGALITITARVEEGRFLMTISDNGVGMRPSKLQELKEKLERYRAESPEKAADEGEGGVGMQNVVKRLRMYYGDEASVSLESEFMHGFRVILSIPAEPFSDPAQEEKQSES